MKHSKAHRWGRLLSMLLTLSMVFTAMTGTIKAADAEEGYKVAVTPSVTSSPAAGETVSLTAKVTNNGEEITDLASAGLKLWWWTDTWNDHADGNGDAVYSNYDDNSGNSLTADVTLPAAGKYYIVAELKNGSESLWKEVTTFNVTEDTGIVGDIDVTKIPNLSDDFIMGMDISSVVSEFKSGVTFQDFEGNTIDNVTDFCKFLKECGITHVRVRVWNNPYDAKGMGYGGGNNDVAAAVEIAQGCAAAGVKMLVDFHYSDFWADPGKQQVPKAWTGYTLEQKVDAVKEFTTDSLQKIAATGADVDMVQVGNETTNSFVGEKGTNYQDMCTLFQAGSEAVRAFNKDTKVVIHFTNPERANQLPNWAKRLHDNNVDYDILATSYYPYWHGTLENLKNQFKTVRETYGKDVMVAETSYAYTLEDTDGHDNTVRKGNNDSVTSYPFTPQGQADCIRDIMAAVNEAGGLGVYYWESAWITVGDTTGLSGDEYTARVEENKTIWEKFGSGWASSYAGEYDAEDAGKWYGGSAVDNQAMFYPNGAPNEGLRVWNYVKTGAVSKTISVDKIEALQEAVEIGGEYQLPETVNVTYNKGSEKEAVKWSEEDVVKIDNSKAGIYVVNGTVTFSKEVNSGDYAGQTSAPVTYTLTVKEKNLITDKDAAGFEKGTDFLIEGAGVKPIPCKEDVLDGAGTLHWYNASAVTSCVTYNKPLTLEAGCYTLEAIAMGFAGDTVSLNILDTDGNILFSGELAEMAGWTLAKNECKIPSVNFKLEKETQVLLQVSLGISDGGWGSADCLYLHKHEDLSAKDLGDGTHQWSCDGCGAELYTEECTMIPAAVNDAAADKMASIVYQCGLCKAEETKEVSVQIQGIETAVNMKVGEKAKLEGGYVAALEPEGVTYAGHYTSGDEGIVKVDDEGNLTAVKAGKTEVAYTVTASVMIDGKEVSFVAAKSVAAVEIAQSQTDPGKNPNPGVKADTKPGVSTGNKTTVNKVVATGDNSNPVLYMILAAGCMMIFAGIFVSRRRKVR